MAVAVLALLISARWNTSLRAAVAAGALIFLTASPPSPAAAPEPRSLVVFTAATGLSPGWTDLGWAPRELDRGSPARLDFSQRGGWIVAHESLQPTFTALVFRFRGPPQLSGALEVHLDSGSSGRFPRVPIAKGAQRALPDGWTEVLLPMSALDPEGAAFGEIVFQPSREVGTEKVLLDDIGFTGSTPAGRSVRLAVECGSPGHPISPLIYGTANGDSSWWQSGTTARRWGGNPSTRYNWQIGNVWNAGNDYFFRNGNYGEKPGPVWQRFLDSDAERHAASAITVPIIGWVAKDDHSYSFPVSRFGAQRAVANENPDIGNGVDQQGQPLQPGPQELTSVAAPPEFVGAWVRSISAHAQPVAMYILDNEPTLWQDTHRDVHPAATTYDELLDRTIRYGEAVRAADPKALIAGFVGWGWSSLSYSAADLRSRIRSDRLLHGGVALLPWWLRRVRDHEKETRTHLIDILDVHWYPQSPNIYSGGNGATDDSSAALRIRSVRSLWDPAYRDESWIDEQVQLIPRLRKWIDENAPGLRISIGEYNFGGEKHMSGGLAQAETLGRFGTEGIYSAFYWSSPPLGSPSYWAFRAYRNFDGAGGRFLDESIPARSTDPSVSIFASRDGSGHEVLVLLNVDPRQSVHATVDVSSCATPGDVRAFSYGGGGAGFEQQAAPAPGRGVEQDLPAYSITVLDLRPKR